MALKPRDKLPSWTMQSSRNSLFHLDLTLFGAGTSYSPVLGLGLIEANGQRST